MCCGVSGGSSPGVCLISASLRGKALATSAPRSLQGSLKRIRPRERGRLPPEPSDAFLTDPCNQGMSHRGKGQAGLLCVYWRLGFPKPCFFSQDTTPCVQASPGPLWAACGGWGLGCPHRRRSSGASSCCELPTPALWPRSLGLLPAPGKPAGLLLSRQVGRTSHVSQLLAVCSWLSVLYEWKIVLTRVND